MTKGDTVIKYAEKFLGKGGSTFRSYCGLPGNAAWCNAFVTYCMHKTDNSKLYCNGRKETYCPHSIQWCYKNLASIPVYLALPGDIIYFDWEKNGVPNHIGFVRQRKSDQEIKTVEGNTSGGIVANKVRVAKYVQAVFRPHYHPDSYNTSKELEIDGFFGYNSIAMLQKVLMVKVDGILGLGTVKALQKYVGVTADGDWGVKTSKAVQKLIGAKVDGFFGPESVKAFQKWLNKQGFTTSETTTKPTKPTTSATTPNKIEAKAKELAWKKGTDEKKYAWKGGSATEAFRKALAKWFPKHNSWGKAPSKGCSCDVFVGTVVRASGLDKGFPRGFDEQWKHEPSSKMKKLTYSNRTPYSVSKPGDVILYHKNAKGTSKHVLIRGDKCLYEAQYEKTYGHVNKSMSKIQKTRPKIVIFRAK